MELSCFKISCLIFAIFGISERLCLAQNVACGLQLENNTPIEGSIPVQLPNAVLDIAVSPQELILGQKLYAQKDVVQIFNISVSNAKNQTNKYVAATLGDKDPKEFKLILGEDFNKYEDYEIETTMFIYVTIVCKGDIYRGLNFKQNITDTNNHDPKFSQESYEYTLPMPLPTGLDLTSYGPKIEAIDKDLTNSKVVYTISSVISSEHESFSFKYENKEEKSYSAKLITSKFINFYSDFELKLTATDNGVPPRNSIAAIKIKINKEKSLPKFSSAIYKANYSKNKIEDNTVLKFDKEIRVDYGTGNITYTLNSTSVAFDVKNALKAEPHENGKVSIKVVKWPSYQGNNLFVELTAEKENSKDSSTLYISLPVTEQESSNGGLLAATIILSLLLVGILIGLAYFYNKHRGGNYTGSLMT